MSLMTAKTVWMLGGLGLLASCGGTFDQGAKDEDTDGDDDGSDGVDGSDGQDGSDGLDGGDDGEVPGPCTHAYHPIHDAGWSKTFSATYNGQSGTATEEGLGNIGDDLYAYRDTISAGTDSYSVQVTVGCDYDGEGMYVLNWAGDYSMTVFDILPMGGTVSSELSPSRKYLPAEYAVGSTGSWSYSYSSNMTWTMDSGGLGGDTGAQGGTVTYTGTYSELGFESYTLPGGESVQAYKLINEYTSSGDVMGAPIPQEGYIEQWWVKGLGMVKEVSYDNADTSTPLMTKTLTAFTGLVPE